MSRETQQTDIAKKAVVYRMPGSEAVTVTRDIKYRVTDSEILTMDVYYPGEPETGSRIPAAVFVLGYPDAGFQRMVGCRQKEMGSYTSWARLVAASGLAAITYTNQDPVADLQRLIAHIRENSPALGIDGGKLGLWACSGNVPIALSVLMHEDVDYLKCAVLCYGFMLDLGESTVVAEAARKWGFANSCAGKSVEDLPREVPLFIARAGCDEFPHLNDTIDCFLSQALARNLPVTLVNHATAPHAFDLMHDSEPSSEIIRQILRFMCFHLSG